jgi:hypothetical protein
VAAGQAALEGGVPVRARRVGAQVVTEQALIAGRPGVGGDDVQVISAPAVLVAGVEQAAAMRSMIGLAARPGTEVLPMCSMAVRQPGRVSRNCAQAASARTGQAWS